MASKRATSDVMLRVMEAATEIFATQGLAGARMDDVAARAGISKALIYYHVDDKESLYAMVMHAILATARESLSSAVAAGEGPEERLRLAIRAIAELATTNRQFAPLMLREIATGGAGLPDAILAEMRKVFAVVAETLSEGIKAGVFRAVDPFATHMLLAGGVLVLMSGAPLRRRVRGAAEAAAEDIPDYVASLVLDGIRVRPAARRPERDESVQKKRSTSPRARPDRRTS